MREQKKSPDGGLSLQTLLISSLSAVIATVAVSQFWAAGTLFFTALVPVAVAVVSEILRRPAQKITEVAPLVAPRVVPRARTDRTEAREPLDDEPVRPRDDDPFGLYTPDRPSVLSGRAVRIGLITGLLAFLIGAAVVTVSELALFDDSIGNRKSRTTLVGGPSKEQARDAEKTPTPDPADPAATATPEATPEESEAPEENATPTPTPTATPTPTPGAAAPTPTPAPPGGSRAP